MELFILLISLFSFNLVLLSMGPGIQVPWVSSGTTEMYNSEIARNQDFNKTKDTAECERWYSAAIFSRL